MYREPLDGVGLGVVKWGMEDSLAPGAREFPATRWSLVLAARGGKDPAAVRAAMEELCRSYWYPLYAFVRMRGHAPEDAQDLTQSFFLHLLRREPPAADPAKGRFRSYLLGALKHFLANEWDRAAAQKRGGGQAPVEWDAFDAEARYALEPACPTAEEADLRYDRRWALELLDRALGRLRRELEERGDGPVFEALKGSLTGAEAPREEIAARLGLSGGALKVAIHRLRQRYREVLRAEIAETVEGPAEVDEEMRYLAKVLRG